MPRLIERPTVIAPAGNKPKQIQEFAGRVNSGHSGVSVARMISPSGWQEPGPASGLRGDHRRAARHAARRARGRHHRRPRRARPSPPLQASGCATARLSRKARNTSPCACRRSRPPPSIATSNYGENRTRLRFLRARRPRKGRPTSTRPSWISTLRADRLASAARTRFRSRSRRDRWQRVGLTGYEFALFFDRAASTSHGTCSGIDVLRILQTEPEVRDAARRSDLRRVTLLEDQHVPAARRLHLHEAVAPVDLDGAEDPLVEAGGTARVANGQCHVSEPVTS